MPNCSNCGSGNVVAMCINCEKTGADVDNYNGWSNYPTWRFVCNLDNTDENQYWNDCAREAYDKAKKVKRTPKTVSRYAQALLAQQMLDEQLEACEAQFRKDMSCGVPYLYDLLVFAVKSVNWIDIADAVLALQIKRDYIAQVDDRNVSE